MISPKLPVIRVVDNDTAIREPNPSEQEVSTLEIEATKTKRTKENQNKTVLRCGKKGWHIQ